MTNAYTTKSAPETQAFGRKLGKLLRGGELIEFSGDLGSGKTTLIKGLAGGLGIAGQISSPTFTISRVYDGKKLRFYHFDFYRLDSNDIVALELNEAANDRDGVVAVEWAEHVAEVLPEEHLAVNLRATAEDERLITVSAQGDKYAALVEKLR